MEQLLSKETLISKNGQVNPAELRKVKFVAFYVGAHCYPPTREFTPRLVDFYNVVNAQGKIFEVIYVSDDREAETMQEYFDEMPWLSIPFSSVERRVTIMKSFNVTMKPALIVCEPDGTAITLNGKTDIDAKQKDAILHWGKIQRGKIRRTRAGREYEIFRLVVQPH